MFEFMTRNYENGSVSHELIVNGINFGWLNGRAYVPVFVEVVPNGDSGEEYYGDGSDA